MEKYLQKKNKKPDPWSLSFSSVIKKKEKQIVKDQG